MIEDHLRTLQQKHAVLEAQIHSEFCRPQTDDVLLKRCKLQKLQIKREMEELERKLEGAV